MKSYINLAKALFVIRKVYKLRFRMPLLLIENAATLHTAPGIAFTEAWENIFHNNHLIIITSGKRSCSEGRDSILFLDDLCEELSIEYSNLLFTLIILFFQPKTVQVLNSFKGWKLTTHLCFKFLIKSKWYLSVFSHGPLSNGQRVGYTQLIPSNFQVVAGYISDNLAILNSISVENPKIPESKFHLAYFPVLNKQFSSRPFTCGKVVWASRLAPEKLPHMLPEIARQLPEINFEFYGEGDLKLVGIESWPNNLFYRGSFRSFELEVACSDSSLFIYTSNVDGLPNVLLEAISSGFFILAPDVGGISELLSKEGGMLLSQTAGVQEYVDAIIEYFQNQSSNATEIAKVQTLVKRRHTKQNFERSIRGIYRLDREFIH